MGFNAAETKHTGRALRRVDHPDIIKITNTPFRFSDGRRNRGSLISPRAVMMFAEGKVKDFNPIRSIGFTEWLTEQVLKGHDAAHWSPAVPPKQTIETVFRKVVKAIDEDSEGRPLDPLRPHGDYHGLLSCGPLREDEIEIGTEPARRARKDFDDDLVVIDLFDDFRPMTAHRPVPWNAAAAPAVAA